MLEEAVALPEPKLRDLRASEAPVAILGRVVALERREVTRRSDRERRVVLSGLLSDGTATVRFTWWDPPPEGVERGMVLRAAGVRVSEYRGRPELSFNWKTRVEPASEVELPQIGSLELPLRALADAAPLEEGFRLEVRILKVTSKSVPVGGESRTVFEGLLADRSGALSFSAWTDLRLQTGEAVRLSGVSVRTFRGRRQLVLDERTRAERMDGRELPSVAESLPTGPRPVAHWEATKGGEAVWAEGVVVGLLPPSGLVYRCPECRRSVAQGACRQHGLVTGVPDLRARLVLDDGTGALTVHLGRPETEKLWGTTLEACLARLRDHPDPGRLEEALFDAVFGLRLRAEGRATHDDFGLTLYPDRVERVTADAGGLAAALRGRLGPGAG